MKAAIHVRKDSPNSDGSYPLAIRISLPGDRKVIRAVGISARLDQLGPDRMLRSQVPGAEASNMLLARALARANDILVTARLRGQTLTPAMVAAEWDRAGSSLDFLAFWENELRMRQHLQMQAPATLAADLVALEKFKKFSPAGLPYAEIDNRYLERFDAWHKMRLSGRARARKGGKSARRKAFKAFRKYLYEARRQGHYNGPNPFERVKVGQAPRRLIYLTAEEVVLLAAWYRSGQDRDVLRPFLFSCFTGLRLSDVAQLRDHHLHGDEILLDMVKTDEPIRLPLNVRAQELIRDGGLPILTISAAYLNRRLKVIAAELGIDKPISFQTGRHTFATNFLHHGRVEVLQVLLGHAKIATTMIYVHVTDARKRDQVLAMDLLFPESFPGNPDPKAEQHHAGGT